jgi:outer membrane protein
MKKLHCIAALLVLAATGAQAQPAGAWLGRIGATQIQPHVKSGDLTAPSLPGTHVDVDDATQLSGGITYMMTNNVAIDVPLSLPFKHDLVGAGAIAGVGKLGEVKALPVTVLAQYRFGDAGAQFRPYVGAGATYAKFFRERSTGVLSALTAGSPTTLSVESKLAPTVQLGGVFNVNERWFVDLNVTKTWLKTRASLSTGQSIDMKLDPTSVSLAVGMRFR